MATVSVDPTGLDTGIYSGSILFSPTDSTLSPDSVPVTLIVGCAQGGCTVQPNILSVVNGASMHPTGSPGAIMTIFGTNLSDAVYNPTSFTLPTMLGPTSVTVNGVAAPLFFVSPKQIDFQMPSGVPATGVTVTVSNSASTGQFAVSRSPSYPATLTPVAPGLFTTPDGRADALNVDFSPNTPSTPAPAGSSIILYITGQGPVTPAVPDGAQAPNAPLSTIDATVQVTIGGQQAQVTYQGLAPGFVGMGQINAIIPSGLTPGNQPVFVTINGLPSNAGVISVD